MEKNTIKRTKTVQFGQYTAELIHAAFPSLTFHGAFVAILRTQLQSGDFENDTAPLMPFVVSWTAPGDPQDVASWGHLDWVTEYAPLRKQITEIVNDHLEKQGGDIPN